ncbi:hypothetical protein [Burkholderia sp. BCC1988]|uniref:hypothetical protein n=1 Tax=Burkholderia sp. BCC1988 TaxID=2817443 RepID=UPI002AAFC1F9|nr:hypothetical protein [Burkholderia sp. BCC1988]
MSKRPNSKTALPDHAAAERRYHAGQLDALGRALNAAQQAQSLEQARRSIKSLLADLKVPR